MIPFDFQTEKARPAQPDGMPAFCMAMADLLFNGVHAFEVGQEQSPAAS